MPKTRQQKEQVLNKLIDDLKNAKGVAMVSFFKLKVSDDQILRKDLKSENITYGVVKKTLLKKAFDKLGFAAETVNGLDKNISLAISAEDEVAPARILNNFSKNKEAFTLVGGLLENNWIDAGKVKDLASLPGKDELIAKVVGTIKAPLSGLANVLAGNIRGLLGALNAIKEQKS